MTGRIRIRVGPVEVEYEGEEEFIREELPKVLSNVAQLVKTTGYEFLPDGSVHREVRKNLKKIHAHVADTTSALASKLDVTSGSELIVAAALKLMHSQHLDSFTREQLIGEMRSATSYFKDTYVKNLASFIDSLVKQGILQEVAKNTYRLSAAALKELEARIAR